MTTHRPLDESDIQLIQRVKATPSLYDPRNSDFRLTPRKEEDWVKVATSLNISISDARRRWTCLRDRYSRELKQLRLNPAGSEYGRNDFFRQMDFLREFVRKRRERSRRENSASSWRRISIKSLQDEQITDTTMDDEQDETQIYNESEHNYDTKITVHHQTHHQQQQQQHQQEHAESYAVLMEEGQEPYEAHYTVQPATPTSIDNATTKHINISPTMLQQSPNASFVLRETNAQIDVDKTEVISSQHVAAQLTTEVCTTVSSDMADDFFCKSVEAYLRQLSKVHKIKAKIEIYQILDKYINLEESLMHKN